MQTRNATGYLLLALLACSGTALAQDDAPRRGVFSRPQRDIDEGALWEDMEVFSNILQSEVDELYGRPNGRVMFGSGVASDVGVLGHIVMHGDTSASGQKRPVAPPVSAYLPGYGVVLQLELPPLQQAVASNESAANAVCPFTSKSPWDRERMRLRGEWDQQDCRSCHTVGIREVQTEKGRENMVVRGWQPDLPNLENWPQSGRILGLWAGPDHPPSAPTREQLIDQLVELLAENGHHVRELGAQESVAIAITFHEKSQKQEPGLPRYQTTPGQVPYGGVLAPSAEERGQAQKPGMPGAPAGLGRPFPARARPQFQFGPTAELSSPGGWVKDNQQNEWVISTTEGDLFLRQLNPVKATEAYEKAWKALEKRWGTSLDPYVAIDDDASFNSDLLPDAQRLLFKLSQAQLFAGNVDKARAVLDNLERLKSRTTESGGEGSTEGTPASLPARLVIRARKSALDDVASQEMTFEQFQEAVQVDFFEPKIVVDLDESEPASDDSASPAKTKIKFK